MAAPLIFTSIIGNLVKGLGTMSKFGPKAALQQGANASAKMTAGFFDGFMQRQSALQMGTRAGKAVRSMVWDAIHDTAYKYGKKTYGTRLASLLSGASSSSLIAGGNVLGMYGGSAESLNQTMTSLTNKLGGLNYGEAGFLKTIMMRSNGMMNIFGSGRNGFATAQELLDNFAEIGRVLDIADFNAIADALGVDVATRKLIRDGEYELLKERMSVLKSDVERQNELGKQQSKTAMEWERMAQQWASATAPFWAGWEKFKGSLWQTIGLHLLSGKMDNKSDVESVATDKADVIDRIQNGERTSWGSEEVKTLLPAFGARILQKNGTGEQVEEWIRNTVKQMGYNPGDEEDREKISEVYARLKEYVATGGGINLQEELAESSGRTNRKKGILIADIFYNEEAEKAKENHLKGRIATSQIELKEWQNSIAFLKGGEHETWMNYGPMKNGKRTKASNNLYSSYNQAREGEGLNAYEAIRLHKLSSEEVESEIEDREAKLKLMQENIKALEKEYKTKYGTPNSANRSGVSILLAPPSKPEETGTSDSANKRNGLPSLPASATLPTGSGLAGHEPVIERTAVTKEISSSTVQHNYSPHINVAMDIHAEGKTAKDIVQIGPDRVEEMIASADRRYMDATGAKYS